MRLGATGEFPDGKLDETDEGELMMAVGHDDRLVQVKFGKPVAWFALTPDRALELASALAAHAAAIPRGKG